MYSRALCMQRMPYTGVGLNYRVMYEWNIKEPVYYYRKNDAYAILPYARTGAPCNGWLGSFDSVQKCRRDHRASGFIDWNVESWEKCTRWSLWFLGCLWCGHQYWNVHIYYFKIHTIREWTFCVVTSNDIKITRENRRRRRPQMLQTKFFLINSYCYWFCNGIFSNRNGEITHNLSLLCTKQTMYWKKMSILQSKSWM